MVRKLYEKKIFLVILIIIFIILLSLNSYKFYDNKRVEKQKIHDSLFVNVADNMKKAKDVTLRKRVVNLNNKSMNKINGYDYIIQQIDLDKHYEFVNYFDNNNASISANYVIPFKNTYYYIDQYSNGKNINNYEYNYLNDYNMLLKLLYNVKDYSKEGNIYYVKFKDNVLKEYISTFNKKNYSYGQVNSLRKLNYNGDLKTVIKLNGDNELFYVKFYFVDMGIEDQVYSIFFSDYNKTNLNVPVEILSFVE